MTEDRKRKYAALLSEKIAVAIEDIADKGEETCRVRVSNVTGRTEDSKHRIRTSLAKMALTNEQTQASRDIDAGYDWLLKGAGYALLGIKTANLTGARGGPDEDAIDRAKRYMGRLHQWQFETPKKHWKTVEALNGYADCSYTARQYAEFIGCNKSTIVTWYKSGLDEYIELFFK